MNSPHSTQRLAWRNATLTAALAVAGIGGVTMVAQDPCAFIRAARYMAPYSPSMLATDLAGLADYCASSPNVVMTGPIFMHILLCKPEVCPLDPPVTADPAVSGTFINPPPVPAAGRLWRMHAEY